MTDVLAQAFSIGMGETAVRFPTPLDRIIHLRTLPNLSGLATRGLTYVATHARERHFETGEVVYDPDEPVSSVHFIVEGRIRVEQDGLHLLDGTPPWAIGFLPVLGSSAVKQNAVAAEPTVTLEISSTDLFEIVEDDFGFLENGIRQLSRQFVTMQAELEKLGLLNRSEPDTVPYPHEALDLVERLELIRGGPYASVNLEPLVQIVRHAEEIRLEPGDVLWEEGTPCTWGVNIAHGVIACSNETRSFRMGPRSVIGSLQSYGGLPHDYRAVAETRVVALRSSAEVFFDVLEDNFTLAIGFLEFLANISLDLSVRLARAREESGEVAA